MVIIKNTKQFNPIIITLETREEVKELLLDLQIAEDFMINTHPDQKKKQLSTVSIGIVNYLDKEVLCK